MNSSNGFRFTRELLYSIGEEASPDTILTPLVQLPRKFAFKDPSAELAWYIGIVVSQYPDFTCPDTGIVSLQKDDAELLFEEVCLDGDSYYSMESPHQVGTKLHRLQETLDFLPEGPNKELISNSLMTLIGEFESRREAANKRFAEVFTQDSGAQLFLPIPGDPDGRMYRRF